MKRGEFMMRLAVLLSDIPDEEKTDALKFYNNYFDDAGPENEENVIAELGSPEKVARSIKESIGQDTRGQEADGEILHSLVSCNMADQEKAESDSSKYQEEKKYTGKYEKYTGKYEKGNWSSAGEKQRNYQKQNQKENKKMSGGMIALIVILVVFASPVLLGLAGGVFGILTGILACVFAFVLICSAGAVGFFVGGIGCLGLGIVRCLTNPVHAIMICGVGMVLLAIGFLLCIVMIFLWGKALPYCIKTIVRLCRKLFKRRSAS